jgi:AcrR family transcriptional regulator
MPKLATEKLKARRRQILEAARKCFTRNGIHSTSMRNINEEAGVSAGLVYRYFPSKQELINSLVKEWDREVIVRLDSFSLSDDPKLSLISVFEQLADWILDLPVSELRLLVHFWAEAAQNTEVRKIESKRLDHFAIIVSPLVSECQLRGLISKQLKPKAVAQMMFTWIQGLIVHRVANPRSEFGDCKKVMLTALKGLFD